MKLSDSTATTTFVSTDYVAMAVTGTNYKATVGDIVAKGLAGNLTSTMNKIVQTVANTASASQVHDFSDGTNVFARVTGFVNTIVSGGGTGKGELRFSVLINGVLSEELRIDSAGNQWNLLANTASAAAYHKYGDGTNTFAQIGAYCDTAVAGAGTGTGHLEIYTLNAGTITEQIRVDAVGTVTLLNGPLINKQASPAATITASATLTNAQISPGIILTSTAAVTLTMPLGTTLETLVTWVAVDQAFDFTVIATAAFTATLAVNTGVTAVGSLTVAASSSGTFRLRRTAANTFIVYRL